MSGSDWGKFSKVIGLASAAFLILCLVYFSAYAMGVRSGLYEGQQETATRHYPGDTQRIIDGCFQLPTRSQASECISEAHKSSHENQRAEKDLIAQRNMADWAWWVLIVGGLQFFATIVTLGFVKLTLDATLEAVRDTSEATEAMRDANTIAREALESQTRPWLKLAVEVFDSQNKGTVVSASITAHTINLGNAPANFVSLVPVILDGEWSTPRILNAVPTLFDDILKGSDPQNQDINLHDRILFQQDEWAYRCDVKTTDFPEECRTGCLIVSLRYSAAGYIKPRYTTLVFDMIWLRDEFPLSEGESTEYVTFRERGCFSAYAD